MWGADVFWVWLDFNPSSCTWCLFFQIVVCPNVRLCQLVVLTMQVRLRILNTYEWQWWMSGLENIHLFCLFRARRILSQFLQLSRWDAYESFRWFSDAEPPTFAQCISFECCNIPAAEWRDCLVTSASSTPFHVIFLIFRSSNWFGHWHGF